MSRKFTLCTSGLCFLPKETQQQPGIDPGHRTWNLVITRPMPWSLSYYCPQVDTRSCKWYWWSSDVLSDTWRWESDKTKCWSSAEERKHKQFSKYSVVVLKGKSDVTDSQAADHVENSISSETVTPRDPDVSVEYWYPCQHCKILGRFKGEGSVETGLSIYSVLLLFDWSKSQ